MARRKIQGVNTSLTDESGEPVGNVDVFIEPQYLDDTDAAPTADDTNAAPTAKKNVDALIAAFDWDTLAEPTTVTFVRKRKTWDPATVPLKVREILQRQHDNWAERGEAGGRSLLRCSSTEQAAAFVKISEKYCASLEPRWSFRATIDDEHTVTFGVTDVRKKGPRKPKGVESGTDQTVLPMTDERDAIGF